MTALTHHFPAPPLRNLRSARPGHRNALRCTAAGWVPLLLLMVAWVPPSTASPAEGSRVPATAPVRLVEGLSRPDAGVQATASTSSADTPAILDAEGRTLVLRGINLGKKTPPYLPDVDETDFDTIASWGFDTIRFLILWAAIEPRSGDYDESYLDRVVPYLDMAYDRGLHVILDMHQDVYGEMFNHDGAPEWACPARLVDGFENRPEWYLDYFTRQVMACFTLFWESASLQDHFIEAWRLAAERLGNHPAVIGFDLFNEPYPGFNWTPRFEPEELQPFYERLIPVLQAEAPEAYVFFEPWVFRDYFVPTFLTPMPFPRLVYFPHFYSPPMELTSTYYGYFNEVQRWVASVGREARVLGVPFAVGEYGGDSQGDGIAELLGAINEALEQAGTGGMYWEYAKSDGSYAILNADGSEKGWILDEVCRAYPMAVAGALSWYDFDTSTGRLDMEYVHEATIEAPTVIAAPKRIYPDGPEVVVSDPETMVVTYDPEFGRVYVTDTGPQHRARTITLRVP